ncbi:MAG: hypothetical protein WCW27_03680 [Patescibacteria group bacterium]|jgi:hypothetical protein
MHPIWDVFKLLGKDIIGRIIYFPIWWYTTGLFNITRHIVAQTKDLVRHLNLKILARFLFTPMYGLYDIWSRAISFPVRVVHFLLLSTYALINILFLLLRLIFWLALPGFVFYNIFYQLWS